MAILLKLSVISMIVPVLVVFLQAINAAAARAQSGRNNNLVWRLQAAETAQCWQSMMELRSCTGEVILFFLNGETYLGPSCCRAINTIHHSCWAAETLLTTLGFTAEEGNVLRGYCDATAPPPMPILPESSVAFAPASSKSSSTVAVRLKADETARCWQSLSDLRSCTGEIILFFLNGETYLGLSCCRAIRNIHQSCWAAETLLSTLGFTAEEGNMLRGYCKAAARPPQLPGSSSNIAVRLQADETAKCWESLTELRSCTGEVILFFLNGETYLGPSCCRAINTIHRSCWAAETLLATLGFTAEEGNVLRGYCDAEPNSSSSSPPPLAPAADIIPAPSKAYAPASTTIPK